MSFLVHYLSIHFSGNILLLCKMSFNISCLLFFSFSLFSSNEDGNSSTVYSIDWNGSAFLVSGDGLVNEPYPNLTVYENNHHWNTDLLCTSYR